MIEMKKITYEDVISWGPCYLRKKGGEERIRELFGGKPYLTLDDLWDMDIPDADKLWVALRDKLLPAKLLHIFACDVAEMVLQNERENGREPDKRIWEAIRIKRLWIDGKATTEELNAAADAAWEVATWASADAADAACAAARAAWEVAEAAARKVAADAAWVVARWASADAAARKVAADAAAREVAREAWEVARKAAREAARADQVKHLRALINEWGICKDSAEMEGKEWGKQL